MATRTFYAVIEDHATPRKCTECLQPATAWRMTADKTGAPNKSSRVPVCPDHTPDE